MNELPSGTMTLLFTDIEGSTKLLERVPKAYRDALVRHHEILGRTVTANDGHVFETIGDGVYAAFSRAEDALKAALAAQHEVHRSEWGEVGELRVRMALHTGALELWTDHYFGPALYRLARLLATGHGGQVLLSHSTYELVRDELPPGLSARDLGEHKLKDLGRPEHVFQLVAPDLRSDFPPLRSLDVLPTNLPAQLTSFVGREREMSEVKRLLSTSRLLTLVGSGGVGKTRLALQVGADLLDDFADGVWLVELGALTDPGQLPRAVAAVLSLREEPGQPIVGTLTSYLRTREMLLVVDNCEHVVEAVARLADGLLHSCAGLKILATSREALGVAGETSWPVPSLAVPDPASTPPVESLTQYEAVRLFIDRALAVRPDFAVTNANAPAVAQICYRLDGIALAIELAAVRVSLFSAEEIASRLEDRFRLLTGGGRTAMPRHQTLQALIDWSYALLSEKERTLLRRLSVFVGGWAFDSAQAVCGDGAELGTSDILDALTQLVKKSLVIVDEQGASTRYRLLLTVRQYAQEKLLTSGETESVRGRHLDHFVRFAEEAESSMRGPEQRAWFQRIELEQENLRAAFAWSQSTAGAGVAGLRLAVALWRFWEERLSSIEVRRWLEGALDRAREATPELRARGLHAAGVLARRVGGFTEARDLFEQSLALSRQLGDKGLCSRALFGLGVVALNTADLHAARRLYEEALENARQVGHVEAEAQARAGLGYLTGMTGERAAMLSQLEESLELWRKVGDQRKLAAALQQMSGAVAFYVSRGDFLAMGSRWAEESRRLFRESGDKRGVALSLHSLGQLAFRAGDREQGRSLLDESAALSRELGDRVTLLRAVTTLGRYTLLGGDHSRARASLEEARAICTELDDRWTLAFVLLYLGRVALAAGDYASARARNEESLALARSIGHKWCVAHASYGLGEVARVSGDGDSATSAYHESLAHYRELGDDPEQARPLRGLAQVALRRGDAAGAGSLLKESLRLAEASMNTEAEFLCLPGLAEVALAEGRLKWAARLFGATERHFTPALLVDSMHRYECEQSLAAARDLFGGPGMIADNRQTLAAAWAEGRSLTLERAVADALAGEGEPVPRNAES